MAVKTKFSEEDFKKILLKYDIGKYKLSKPFKKGTVQTNVCLETSNGKYVFRYYEIRTKAYAEFEVIILGYLKDRNYPCQRPIGNMDRDLVGVYKNKPYVILEYLEGNHRKSLGGLQIASIIGKLHKITIGYKPMYYESRDTYDPECCWRYVLDSSKKIKSKSEAKKRLDWLKDELDKLEYPKDLPKGVCHCDVGYSNILYVGNKISAVLDFDDAAYINLVYDVSQLLYFWAWPDKGEFNFETARKLLGEYEKQRKLIDIEKEHLYDALKMVIFMSIGWFVYEDADFINERRKIEFLNSIGREEFYNKLFKN